MSLPSLHVVPLGAIWPTWHTPRTQVSAIRHSVDGAHVTLAQRSTHGKHCPWTHIDGSAQFGDDGHCTLAQRSIPWQVWFARQTSKDVVGSSSLHAASGGENVSSEHTPSTQRDGETVQGLAAGQETVSQYTACLVTNSKESILALASRIDTSTCSEADVGRTPLVRATAPFKTYSTRPARLTRTSTCELAVYVPMLPAKRPPSNAKAPPV
mmetsp:Transcript_830/g.2431  ORF Transcript_830/g.2431 Transcript_830/m.2431 type:complete len:211 (-) Transcript_830:3777-4409(-)